MSNYKIEDIEIGDEVYFNVKWQTNYDLYWTVTAKNGTALEIKIDDMGADDRIWLEISDVYRIQKRSK